MIAAADRQQAVLLRPIPADPVLIGHLDGHLHGHGARIGQKDLGQGLRRHPDQGPAQLHGRLVGQPAEHDVGHALELVRDRGVQNGVVVAVDGRPPGGHAVHEFPAALELQAHAMGGNHLAHGQGVGR